ncbi:MAG: hypothetical protein QOJ81_458 [Chloroflexota bacterium]|jgi:hypothetical protein|nr:hypothetical protein [Chloroflexota bacterium]
MFREAEDGAIQSDAYIEALLSGHARLPVALPVAGDAPAPSVRHVIRTLERGMPRFHPSFLFEERLAEQLRALADQRFAGTPVTPLVLRERRVVIGGAIASGMSLAGAAMWAWRHRPRGTEMQD